MHLRFSLRLVLLVFALLALVLYTYVVRPTAVANEFVAAVMREDFPAARQLIVGPHDWVGVVEPADAPSPDSIYAEVLPRDWGDLWRGRRRVIFRIARHNDVRGGHTEWTEDTDVIAGPRGVRFDLPPGVNFNWPTRYWQSSPRSISNPGEGMRLEPNLRTG